MKGKVGGHVKEAACTCNFMMPELQNKCKQNNKIKSVHQRVERKYSFCFENLLSFPINLIWIDILPGRRLTSREMYMMSIPIDNVVLKVQFGKTEGEKNHTNA